jgi:lipopolysaccharide biosynthesis protein
VTAARFIAFYLPQFYPTPENDQWWGPGFTEWTNVVQARPLFEGHYQPRLPADLGFYDLRVAEVRQAQAALALKHGVEGFCYWHYWFHGTRVLDRPFSEVLASGEPDFPFCLSWANETWSRRWHGAGAAADEVLVEQRYSEEDDLAHVRWLMHAFADPRYIRIGGRPLFLVYRPFDLPDARRTTEVFRT